MNECFTDLIFRNFRKKEKDKGRGAEEEGEEAEGEVS